MKQMKEQGKSLQDQTKEEEMGSLTEKGNWLIIVKLIQNLRNRMETHTSSLEAQNKKDTINILQGPRRTKEQAINN